MKAPYICAPLNAQQSRVLKHLVEGGWIDARRNYPHGFHYWLSNKKGYRYAGAVSETTIEVLSENELLRIDGFHIGFDQYKYAASKTGHEAYERGTVRPPDAAQLTLIPENNA